MKIANAFASSSMRLVLQVATQLLVAPVLLSHWTSQEFGTWLLYVTLVPFLQVLDLSVQTYLGGEALRNGTERKIKRRLLERQIYAAKRTATWASLSVSLALFIALLVMRHLESDLALSNEFDGINAYLVALLLVHSGLWTLTGVKSSLYSKVATNLGYYSRYTAWTIGAGALSSALLCVSCILGFSPAAAIITQTVGVAVMNGVIARDAYLKLVGLGIGFLGSRNRLVLHALLKGSSQLVGVLILDLVRQSGIRLVVAPLLGVQALAHMVTTKTLLNFGTQAVSTVVQPLQPYVMQVYRGESGSEVYAILRTLGYIMAALMPIGNLVLFEPLILVYSHWTRYAIEIDRAFFSVAWASATTMTFGLPYVYFVQGLNRTRDQLRIALLSIAVATISWLLFLKSFGLTGIGLALLAGELSSIASLMCVVALNNSRTPRPSTIFQYLLPFILFLIGMGFAMALQTDFLQAKDLPRIFCNVLLLLQVSVCLLLARRSNRVEAKVSATGDSR